MEVDLAKIEEDLKYAGYNLMVTSELDMEPEKVYQTTITYGRSRNPSGSRSLIWTQGRFTCKKKKQILWQFLICYLSLFLLRVFRIKVFKNEINSYDLISFMRDFRGAKGKDGSYINISRNQAVNEKIKKLTGLTNLDALYLSEKEVENLFKNCMLIESEY